MANQIGKFFASQGPDRAVAGTAEHIKKFWDPRMRAAILAHLEEGGAGLDPAVREAWQFRRQGRRGKTEDTDAKLANKELKKLTQDKERTGKLRR